MRPRERADVGGEIEALSRAADELGNAAAARVRLVVRCRDCGRQVEPDPGEIAERCGAETTVIDWHARLTCSGCGSRQVDFVVTGTERR
jgi:hypothetical protein